MSLPGGCLGKKDEVVWHFGKDGTYSVRSGYHVLMERIVDLSYLRVNGDWSKLWKVDLPPRMSNFVWRLAREILPTRTALQRRGMTVPYECGMCSREPEEAWHLFITCEFAVQCWRKASLLQEVERAMQDMKSCSEWVFNVINIIQEPQQSYIFAIAWSLWRERNARIWEGTRSLPEIVVGRGMDAWQDWKTANTKETDNGVPMQRSEQYCAQWHAPRHGYVKCNCDAAIFEDKDATGAGMVLRDEEGLIIATRMSQLAIVILGVEDFG
ncbi:Putative ribonuclease H protein At1g65750 [Linum perenne]